MDTPEEEPHFERSLKKLERSTSAFSWLATIVVTIVFVSSVWTNYKVITLTTGLKHTQHALAKVVKDNQANATQARISSCHQYNRQQHRNRVAFIDNAAVLAAQVVHPTARQAAEIALYIAAQRAKSVVDFPDRDCTPAGIAAYLGLPQP